MTRTTSITLIMTNYLEINQNQPSAENFFKHLNIKNIHTMVHSISIVYYVRPSFLFPSLLVRFIVNITPWFYILVQTRSSSSSYTKSTNEIFQVHLYSSTRTITSKKLLSDTLPTPNYVKILQTKISGIRRVH